MASTVPKKGRFLLMRCSFPSPDLVKPAIAVLEFVWHPAIPLPFHSNVTFQSDRDTILVQGVSLTGQRLRVHQCFKQTIRATFKKKR